MAAPQLVEINELAAAERLRDRDERLDRPRAERAMQDAAADQRIEHARFVEVDAADDGVDAAGLERRQRRLACTYPIGVAATSKHCLATRLLPVVRWATRSKRRAAGPAI